MTEQDLNKLLGDLCCQPAESQWLEFKLNNGSISNNDIGEIHQRIGTEIPYRKLKAQLYNMLELGELNALGKLKGRKCFLDKTV